MSVLARLDRLQQRNRVLGFCVAVVRKFSDDGAGRYAALLAYYAFLATFPLLLVALSVLGIALSSDPALQQRILDSSLSEFPVVGDQLRANVHSLDRSGVALVVGLVVALFGAKGLADTAQVAFNGIWAVPYRRRPGFPASLVRSMALLAVIGTGAAGTGAVALLLAGGGQSLAVRAALLPFGLALTAAFFVAGFRAATAAQVRTMALVPGAVLAAVAWQSLLAVGGLVVAHSLKGATQVYGVFAGVLGLLAWFALQAQVTLYAAEIDTVRVGRLWPRSLTHDPLTGADRAALTGYAEVEQRLPGQTVTTSFDGEVG